MLPLTGRVSSLAFAVSSKQSSGLHLPTSVIASFASLSRSMAVWAASTTIHFHPLASKRVARFTQPFRTRFEIHGAHSDASITLRLPAYIPSVPLFVLFPAARATSTAMAARASLATPHLKPAILGASFSTMRQTLPTCLNAQSPTTRLSCSHAMTRSLSRNRTETPNHALQRTAPRVTARAFCERSGIYIWASIVRATVGHAPRHAPPSLSLGSLGDSAHQPSTKQQIQPTS